MSTRRILLPEPPPPFAAAAAVPEIFGKGQQSAVVRRAVIIGNGFPGAEGQSLGLLRALGMGQSVTLHRVTRPSGLLNEYLRWLPVRIHKQVDACLLRTLHIAAKLFYQFLNWLRGRYRRLSHDVSSSSSNQLMTWQPSWLSQGRHEDPLLQSQPLLALVPPPVEADSKAIATSAVEGMKGEEGPLLVVACGRDTMDIAADIKRRAGSATFVVQILHPQNKTQNFDLVVTPQHDYFALTSRGQQEIHKWLRPFVMPPLPDRKVVLTNGSLHLADAAMLRASATSWHEELGHLPKPLVVVNIGGPTRHCAYGTKFLTDLAKALVHVHEISGGTIRVSFSHRTPLKMRKCLSEELEGVPGLQIWYGDGPNLHFGHLAWGDAFVVTADSVTMISEACSTGKPVYVVGQEYAKWKLAEFLRTLKKRGCIRPLMPEQDMNEFWSYPPLQDDADVANRVREELAKQGYIIPSKF